MLLAPSQWAMAAAWGGEAFVGASRGVVVEIAHFTLVEFTGCGYATQTVTHLVAIARQAQPGIAMKAFTWRAS